MRHEFSDSFSFNQMLLVSAFVHLFFMTVIMFLPIAKTLRPVIIPAVMVEFIDVYTGNIDEDSAKSSQDKVMPPIAEKNKAAKESKNAVPLPVVQQAKIPPPKPQPPVKGSETIMEKVAKAPKPVIPEVMVPKPVVTKPIFTKPMVKEPVVAEPKVPLKTVSPPVLEKNIPNVIPIPEPKISKPKLTTPQPKEIVVAKPLPKPSITQQGKSLAVELDQLASLPPSKAKEPVAENSISDQTFAELDALKMGKTNIEQVKSAPRLGGGNPLEGFDSVAMNQEINTDSPDMAKKLPYSDPTMLAELEFKALTEKSVDMEKSSDSVADNLLQDFDREKKLKEVTRRQPLDEVSGRSKEGANKVSADITPKYEHVDIEVIQRPNPKEFKSEVRNASVDLPNKKTGDNVASLDRSRVKASSDKPGKPSADILSQYVGFIREKVLANWKNPLGAEDKQVLVTFLLYPGGNVMDPFIEKSSGNSQLDALALRAIANSAPFPKFPPEFSQQSLHISIHFKYVYAQD